MNINETIIKLNIKLIDILKSVKFSYLFGEIGNLVEYKNMELLTNRSIMSFSSRINLAKLYNYKNSWIFVTISLDTDTNLIKIELNFKYMLYYYFFYDINNDTLCYNDNVKSYKPLNIDNIVDIINIRYEENKTNFFQHVLSISTPIPGIDRINNDEDFKNAMNIVNLIKY